MILHALQIIQTELNQHLNSIAAQSDDTVVIGNIGVLESQDYTPDLGDNIVLSLIRIQEEATLKNQLNGQRNMATGRMEYKNPPVPINLYLLFAVNSNSYANALTYQSRIIRFFQSKNVFTHLNSVPVNNISDHDRLRSFRLILDLYSPSFEENNHIWSVLGSKQLPYVMYKMRLLELELEQISQTGGLIEEIVVNDEVL